MQPDATRRALLFGIAATATVAQFRPRNVIFTGRWDIARPGGSPAKWTFEILSSDGRCLGLAYCEGREYALAFFPTEDQKHNAKMMKYLKRSLESTAIWVSIPSDVPLWDVGRAVWDG